MPHLALTQKAIAKLAAPHPDGKQTVYWDTATKGFGVVCSGRTNQRLYVAQRDVGGRTRRVTLGTVSGLPLQEARQRAEDMLDALRRGVDPKKKDPASATLQTALDVFLAARPNLRPASVIAYRQIERHLAP